VIVVLVLLALFAGLNWPAFTAPTTLNLLFAKVQAPLGLVMLGVVLVLTLLYVLFSLGVEASALIEVRRYARELYQTRKLLENEEESRFLQLKGYLEAEFARESEALAGLEKALGEGFAGLKAALGALEDHLNALAEGQKGALKEELERVRTQIDTLKLQHREIVQKIEAAAERLRGELGQAAPE
jgi:uncharacterized integral membrane protein